MIRDDDDILGDDPPEDFEEIEDIDLLRDAVGDASAEDLLAEDILGEDLSEEELEELLAQIERGEDPYALPVELVEEMEVPLRLSLAAEIGSMKVGARIKLALKGNREARGILIRDSARLVRKFVLQNPRITDDEIIIITKNRSADSELIDAISKRKEWIQNYQIRLGLVTNPKTPMSVGLRLVNTLLERDLRQLAKSKNVPGAVNSAAKRLVVRKDQPPTGGGGGH